MGDSTFYRRFTSFSTSLLTSSPRIPPRCLLGRLQRFSFCALFSFSLIAFVHISCKLLLMSHVRDQVRIVHLGGYFSTPPGISRECCVKHDRIMIRCRRIGAFVFLYGRQSRHSCDGSSRQYIRCKLCYRLDVQALSSSIDLNSHVRYSSSFIFHMLSSLSTSCRIC